MNRKFYIKTLSAALAIGIVCGLLSLPAWIAAFVVAAATFCSILRHESRKLVDRQEKEQNGQ